jgi:hypothetical protein
MSAPLDDSEIVERIRALLTEPYSDEYVVLQLRLLLAPQPDPRPIATDEHGWPLLNEAGTAWERHDDPEAGR